MLRALPLLLLASAAPAADWVKPALAAADAKFAPEAKSLGELYLDLHRTPELSLLEVKTAAKLAGLMRDIGFDVTEKVGGTGIVCVLKNGPGPTVLVRTDLDGLPVLEATGLPYASTFRMKDRFGVECPVMHACGHDIHMTCWIGTAKMLAGMKDRWGGTLVFIGQSAEEVGAGAKQLLEAGLYEKFPKPDVALALHADAQAPAGVIRYCSGMAMANVDSVDITVKGKGGHGAAPHTTVDPIVLAAQMVLDFQTIASREVDPVEPVVVTVGSIHGGSKHNIIPNDVKLQLTVRTTKDTVRDKVLKAIDRKAKAAAAGMNAPAPDVKVALDEFTPAMLNDPALTAKTCDVFRAALGAEKVVERPVQLGGEDFARYAAKKTPIFMFFLGTIPEERYAASKAAGGKPLPSMHADGYFPDPDPSIRTGVRAMTLAVLNVVKK